MMCLLRIPALDQRVVAVALMLWFVYICDKDAALLKNILHHGVERVRSDGTRFIPYVVSDTPIFSWILKNESHFGYNFDKYSSKNL